MENMWVVGKEGIPKSCIKELPAYQNRDHLVLISLTSELTEALGDLVIYPMLWD